MNSMRLLIVDDEPLIRRGLRNGLSGLAGIEVIGECENGQQAVDTILADHPELVLLDVQMPDFDGLEVVRRVGPDSMPMVIFVTAYDDYALNAFELNAIDYVLKPFDDERLHKSIERARERLAAHNDAERAKRLTDLVGNDRQWPERLVVRDRERYDFVPVDSIDWIESANNYVQLHCGTRTHLMGETLTRLEARLNPERFVRVHRCHIVNVSRITAAHPMLNGTYALELRSGSRVNTGRQYKETVQALIKG
jgi:two-component system LytT family response regulator